MLFEDSIPATLDEKPSGLAAIVLTAYLFFLFSRLFEVSALIGIGNLYVMLVLSVAGLVIVLFKGDLLRAVQTRSGTLLTAFTLWGIAALPFSSWKSESLNVMLNTWLKSVAAFFIIVGLSRTFGYTKRLYRAMGYAAIASVLLMAILLYGHLNDDRVYAFGSLGNANELAFHLLLGIPYLVLLMPRANIILKLLLVALCFVSLVLSLKTASRAGLLIAGSILIVALLRVSVANKFKLITVAAIGLVVGVSVLDKAVLERLQTLWDSNSPSSLTAMSAKESADVRKYKLQQSIELTYTNPLFGVGMGVFTPASGALSASKGEKQYWIASHNSYTQISSELGVPGFLIAVGIFAVCIVNVWMLNSRAARLGLTELRNMSLAVLLSLITLSIHFFFDSLAYDYYLPMISGMATALIYTSRPLLEAASENRNVEELSGQTIEREETITTNSLDAAANQVPAMASVPSSPPAAWKPNPYRLGRRRSVATSVRSDNARS